MDRIIRKGIRTKLHVGCFGYEARAAKLRLLDTDVFSGRASEYLGRKAQRVKVADRNLGRREGKKSRFMAVVIDNLNFYTLIGVRKEDTNDEGVRRRQTIG